MTTDIDPYQKHNLTQMFNILTISLRSLGKSYSHRTRDTLKMCRRVCSQDVFDLTELIMWMIIYLNGVTFVVLCVSCLSKQTQIIAPDSFVMYAKVLDHLWL